MNPAAESTTAVIRSRDLRKDYRNGSVSTPVLRGVSFEVAKGECLFLVGPSGSGKTTLLSILGCVLSGDGGSLEMLGEDVSQFTAREQARFRRERVGFVFQRFHLFDALTAVENVRVTLDLLGWPKRKSTPRALELLAAVGLTERAQHRATQLSMGQKQRVALARALAGNPELILADEPTASLDAESGLNAMRLLKELCQQMGKTVVVVTHDSRIFGMADRILRLADGRIVEPESAARTSL